MKKTTGSRDRIAAVWRLVVMLSLMAVTSPVSHARQRISDPETIDQLRASIADCATDYGACVRVSGQFANYHTKSGDEIYLALAYKYALLSCRDPDKKIGCSRAQSLVDKMENWPDPMRVKGAIDRYLRDRGPRKITLNSVKKTFRKRCRKGDDYYCGFARDDAERILDEQAALVDARYATDREDTYFQLPDLINAEYTTIPDGLNAFPVNTARDFPKSSTCELKYRCSATATDIYIILGGYDKYLPVCISKAQHGYGVVTKMGCNQFDEYRRTVTTHYLSSDGRILKQADSYERPGQSRLMSELVGAEYNYPGELVALAQGASSASSIDYALRDVFLREFARTYSGNCRSEFGPAVTINAVDSTRNGNGAIVDRHEYSYEIDAAFAPSYQRLLNLNLGVLPVMRARSDFSKFISSKGCASQEVRNIRESLIGLQ
ncbi:MAG: hypothetical protein KDA53_11870 [Hyphomonas sp.]|nr:hypothetical protein [Hyphomonas sp.]